MSIFFPKSSMLARKLLANNIGKVTRKNSNVMVIWKGMFPIGWGIWTPGPRLVVLSGERDVTKPGWSKYITGGLWD